MYIVIDAAYYDSNKTPVMLQLPIEEQIRIFEATKDGDNMRYRPSREDVVVKIGDVWYHHPDDPIEVHLSSAEGQAIGQMDREEAPNGKFALFPNIEEWTQKQMHEWMNT